jgi:hypothetical protein
MSEDKIPPFPLGRINNWREKLFLCAYKQEFLSDILDGVVLDEFTRLVMRTMKIEDELVVRQTLMPFVGQELTARVVDLIGLRFAGNLADIREGKMASGRIKGPTWLPLEVSEIRYGRIRRDKTYVDMVATVMAGALAGEEIRKEFSYKLAVWPLANSLAWTLRDARPVHSELARMWFMGLLQMDGRKIVLDQFKCLPNQRKWNRALRSDRTKPCIRHYKQRCHTCPLGYLTDCYRATHRYTLIVKTCKSCKRENAAFDPERPAVDVCISCQTKEARAHWARERMSVS